MHWQLGAGSLARVSIGGAGAELLTSDREAARRRSGRARLAGDATLELGLVNRAVPVRLDFYSDPGPSDAGQGGEEPGPIGPQQFIASQRLSSVLLPRILSPRFVAWPQHEQAQVTVERASGVSWRFAVNGAGPCEVLLSVWPPRQSHERLEINAGGRALAQHVPGRSDVVRISGTAPFDLTVKKGPSEEFAFAVRVAGEVVPATQINLDGRRMASEVGFSLIIPAWLPPLTDDLAPGDPESETQLPAWRIERVDPAGVFGAEQALSAGAQELVRRLTGAE